MPRTVDLQLLVLAMATGALMAWADARRSGTGRVGTGALLGALLVAWVADRRMVHALPSDLVDGAGPWMVAGAMGLAVGWGARRLPSAPTLGVPPALPLALASLVGVWVGVPETSAAILAAGVLLGVAAALLVGGGALAPRAAIAVAVVPVGTACIGAAGNGHTLLGGLLGSATFVALGLGGRIPAVPAPALPAGTTLHLGAALVAGRHVGVSRDWDGAFAVSVLVIGLSHAAAAVLRRGQERPAP